MTDTTLTAANIESVTRANLLGKVDEQAIHQYFASAGLPHVAAVGSLSFLGIVGPVECQPKDEHSEWQFKTDVWGAGFAAISGVTGTLSTSIGWSNFFKETTGCHVQTTAYQGGWLQINFFRKLELIGQLNGLVVGVGLVEAGGNGHGKKK